MVDKLGSSRVRYPSGEAVAPRKRGKRDAQRARRRTEERMETENQQNGQNVEDNRPIAPMAGTAPQELDNHYDVRHSNEMIRDPVRT